jgi:hypothetical protein
VYKDIADFLKKDAAKEAELATSTNP